MGFTGGTVRNVIVPMAKKVVKGLFADIYGETPNDLKYQDALAFCVCTGSTDIPDVGPVAGTVPVLNASWYPPNWNVYITELEVSVIGGTAWSGGTGTAVSLTIEDSSGNAIASFTQAALAADAYYALPVAGVLPTGVTDVSTRAMGNTGATGVSINAVISNSNAGSNVRVRIRGYFSPR